MFGWLKQLIVRYDAWCASMGLTPENKRSCVPYRRDPAHDVDNSSPQSNKARD
ncbi:DUF5363 family protein [Vibrio sp. RE86]|uniref:DUF5363 family protein n=1 Tax=Vibrio sp. RE86 TaxID=2607605 RepID=UPI0014938736|nr:DUF5363 family protein [Vibrio sp. RE86]